MDRFFIAIYRFFEKKKSLMYGLLILSSVIFVYFGSKVQYEENIAKLLPQTDVATESGLAFGNLRVKDKIFIQLTSAEDEPIAPETLAEYCDELVERLLEKDTATHYIANILYQIDDDLIINGLDYSLTHVPSFVDTSCYERFDSLLTLEAIDKQMALNYEIVMADDEGNNTTIVSQDPAALRMAMLGQGLSLTKGAGGFTIIDEHLFVPDSTVVLAFMAPNFSSFDSKSGTLLIDFLEEEIKHFKTEHPEVEVYFHGSPVNSVFNSRQIKSDLLLTVGLSLIVICIVLGYCFRNKSTLFMLLSPVAYGCFFGLACTQNQKIEWPQVTNETKPWTRWWWEGNAVRTTDLDTVMRKYQEANLGGLEITPIYGIHGYEDRFKDFLSSEWVDLFLYTLQEAKQLGLGIDLANASGWPFGGPWVTPEDACKTVAYKTYQLKEGEQLSEPVRYKEEGFVRLAGHTPVKLADLKEPVSANADLQTLALDQVRYKKELPLIIVTANSDKGECLDLTSKIKPEGTLDWTAPQGDWTICALFQGHHGKMVERAGPGGEGDVIDHFSASAIDHYLSKFDEAFKGKDISYLRYYFNDSYEVDDARGESNWTPAFFDEFQKYRGYDLRQHLPALLGMDTPDKNARVLYDYRQTINDLLINHYSIRWQHWAAKQGKGIRNQAHGSLPIFWICMQ